MTESGTETDRLDSASSSDQPSLLRVIADFMTNRHRGYAGLRQGGGVHPVPGIGTEVGGPIPVFDNPLTDAEVLAILRDGILANAEHVLPVRADGPFNGFDLAGHSFTAQQYAFTPFTLVNPTDLPTPQRIVNANGARLTVQIRPVTLSASPLSVWIGNSENVSPANGWPLRVGDPPLVVKTRSEIWACSNDTAQAVVAILAVHRDG